MVKKTLQGQKRSRSRLTQLTITNTKPVTNKIYKTKTETNRLTLKTSLI